MNWYKKAKGPILDFLSHNSYGELRISINGNSYTYYGVSPYWANKLKWMIEKSNIPSGIIIQRLKKFSDPKKYKELNPSTGHSTEEKQEIMNELYERGILD